MVWTVWLMGEYDELGQGCGNGFAGIMGIVVYKSDTRIEIARVLRMLTPGGISYPRV